MPPGVDMASILSWLSPSPVINTHTQEEEEEGSTDASLLAHHCDNHAEAEAARAARASTLYSAGELARELARELAPQGASSKAALGLSQ